MTVAVSIIVPIRNAQDYLKDCLTSIISQTLRDIEVICVDDASTDASLSICENIAASDARVTVIHLNENMGAANVRNLALSHVSGDYVMFMDADDWYPNDSILEKLYDAAISSGCAIVGGSMSEYDSNTGEVIDDYTGRGHLEAYQFTNEGVLAYDAWQSDLGWIRFMYQRSLIIDNRIEFPPLKRHEDPVFLVRAMLAAKSFYAIPDVVYRYRIFHKPLALSDDEIRDAFVGMSEVMMIAQEHSLASLERWTLETMMWYASLSPQIKALEKERDTLRVENEDLVLRCRAMESVLDEIVNSKSYKLGNAVATPYRTVVDALRRNRH